MKSDSLFFRLFKELPRGFFEMIGRPETDVRRFEMSAIEFKDVSLRLDGVFQPRDSRDGPAYLWEAQCYSSNAVYANLMSKIGRFMESGNLDRDWVAVVIYPTRSLEQKNLWPCRCLIESEQLIRVYLDELPSAPPDHFELGVLQLIAAKPDSALEQARAMVPRLRSSKRSLKFQRRLVQFIETVILHQFPKMSRQEIETMLQVSDVRETRVFQEALEEGLEKGLEKGRKEGQDAISEVARKLLALELPLAEIAEATGLSPAKIRSLKSNSKNR